MTETDNHLTPLNSDEDVRADNSEENAPTSSVEREEFRTLAASYEKKLDEVAELITRVRHEINNPLTGVLGQAQLLLREDLSDRARKRAETIEEMAIRIRDIVSELRKIQKPSKA
jgi:signal transduction histidine kinase